MLTAAAEVLDGAAFSGLAGRLRAADLERASATTRYRRLIDALEELPNSGSPVADFLSGDAVILARMSAAAEVMGTAGFQVDTAGGTTGHLRRAVHWRRCAQGPVSELYRRCAADISRGSLRLWAQAGGAPQPVPRQLPSRVGAVRNRKVRATFMRGQAQLARVQLGAQARVMCSALRAELGGEAAQLSRRDLGAFEGRVRREALRVATELDQALDRRLAGLVEVAGVSAAGHTDQPGEPVEVYLPLRRSPRLENRLSALLGVGFGFSVSLTAGRLVAELRPSWASAAAFGCGAAGLLLTIWIVGARRLLTERAVMERRVVEAVANLRVALEERLITRVLAVESALAADFADPVSDRHPHSMGNNPN